MIMQNLEVVFNHAIETNAKYIGVLISTEGKKSSQLTIHLNKSFGDEKENYKNNYTKNLESKHIPKSNVLDIAVGNNLAEIEDILLGSEWMTTEVIAAIPTKRLVGELERRSGVYTYKVPFNDDDYTIKTEVGEQFNCKLTTIRESKGPCTILEVTDYRLMTDEKDVK